MSSKWWEYVLLLAHKLTRFYMQHSKSNSKIILYKFCCISFVQSNRFYPTWKTNPSKKLWYNRNNRLKFANIPTWNTKGAWLFIEQIWITINQELNALCQIWMILLERIKMRNIYRSPDRAKNIYNEIKKNTKKKSEIFIAFEWCYTQAVQYGVFIHVYMYM